MRSGLDISSGDFEDGAGAGGLSSTNRSMEKFRDISWRNRVVSIERVVIVCKTLYLLFVEVMDCNANKFVRQIFQISL